MASTPSASALSAVLRCQGNILARNQANKKRPPAAVYGLRTACGDSVKSYFRSLWGFIFHRERVEIPGILSVTARLETSCSGKSSIRNAVSKDLAKNFLKTDTKVSTTNQWSKATLKPDSTVAIKSPRYSILPQNNIVLRLDGTFLRKLNLDYPLTCCICVVCVHNKSSLNHSNANSLFSLGLLCFFKDKLLGLTTAVSDSVLTPLLGRDWKDPECNKLRRCARCASEHHHGDKKARS